MSGRDLVEVLFKDGIFLVRRMGLHTAAHEACMLLTQYSFVDQKYHLEKRGVEFAPPILSTSFELSTARRSMCLPSAALYVPILGTICNDAYTWSLWCVLPDQHVCREGDSVYT